MILDAFGNRKEVETRRVRKVTNVGGERGQRFLCGGEARLLRAMARELFERLLSCRSRHGLLAEHLDPQSCEQWGNFVQTYSMVGLINSAIRLSIRWDQAF